MNRNDEIKTSLLDSLRRAGYTIGKMYYETNLELDEEDVENKSYLLPDGRPEPNWLTDGVGDQLSHSLGEIGDYIVFDTRFFPKAQCDDNEAWEILDEYFDYDEMIDALYKGWELLMVEEYGKDWQK